MIEFKDTIPLMVELKNESLRERHWSLLMTKTGHTFDMSNGNFTLQQLFLMKLHQHKSTVYEIVNTAVHEVVIERAVEDLIAKWNSMTFTLKQHFKRQEERG